MNKELNTKLDELFELLDKLSCINNLERIKKNIPLDLISKIDDYRKEPTVSKKKDLYNNPVFLEYVSQENELNLLIFSINQKFKNRGQCENN